MAAHSKQKDQDKALEMALAQIDKQFGSGCGHENGRTHQHGDRSRADRCAGT